MPETAQLGIDVTEHSVVGMTSEAGVILRDSIVLKMSGGNVGRIVDIQAPAMGFHDVARQAKLRRCRVLQVNRRTHDRRDDRQDEEGKESNYLAALLRGDGRPQQQQPDQNDT